MQDKINTVREALAGYDVPKAVYAALAELEAAMRTPATQIVRDCCEAEKADPDHPDTICISVQDLTGIVECYAAPPAQQAHTGPVMHKPSGFTFDQVLGAVDNDDLMPLTPQQAQAEAVPTEDTEAKVKRVEALLDDFMERDPDRAQRFIESQLTQIAVHKRLKAKQAEAVPMKLIGYYHKAPSGDPCEDDFFFADAINGDCPNCHPCYIDASVTVHPTPASYLKPMTVEQQTKAAKAIAEKTNHDPHIISFMMGVEAAQEFHGITAQKST